MSVPRLDLIGIRINVRTLRLRQVETRQAPRFAREAIGIVVVIAELPERVVGGGVVKLSEGSRESAS